LLIPNKDLLQQYPPSQIIFMGDSAGGGMAISLAQLLKQRQLHSLVV